MREVIRFQDAVALLLRLLKAHCPLTVRVAVDFCGRRVARMRWLLLDGIAWGSESVIGGAEVECSGVGAADGADTGSGSSFHCVFCWCVRGVAWKTRGNVGLLDGVNPAVTLGAGTAFTFDGVVPYTLCGSALSTRGGVATSSLWRVLLYTMAASFLTAAMCFCLSVTEVGMNFWNDVRRSMAVVMVFSCLLTTGIVQCDRSR